MGAARSLALAALLAATGCGKASLNAEVAEVLGPGSPLGDVVARHGAPGAVRVAGPGFVLVEYPVARTGGVLGLWLTEERASLCYGVQRTRAGTWVVTGGERVPAGRTSSPFGSGAGTGLATRAPLVGFATLLVALGALTAGASLPVKPRFVKRATLVALVLGLVANGRHACGTEGTTLVAPGSPAGQVPAMHGAPDETFVLPEDAGAIVCYWIHQRAGLGPTGGDQLRSIAYHVQNGKVTSGGSVLAADGTWVLIPCYVLDHATHGFEPATLAWLAALAGTLVLAGSGLRRLLARRAGTAEVSG